jgi:iron transport multicopper oxidase
MWDGQNKWTDVKPGTTVRFHVVNIGAFGFFHLWIEEHEMTVIEVDGVDVQPYQTSGLSVAVGQRYSILVTMKNETDRNYPIVGAMDQDMFDSPSANPNVTGWLRYNRCAPLPEPELVLAFPEFDDMDLVPIVAQPPVPYDMLIPLTVNFSDFNGINYAIVNNNTYEAPNVPALFTALTTGANATNPETYGALTNTNVLNHLDMIWLVINNDDTGSHPCTSSQI